MLATFVIPVYKVEECYLRECLDSLLRLKTQDVEFIVVDDGSPDNAGNICDEYGEKDSRFKIIHKENEGVSVARNTGIDLSTGRYLTFIDADDWIESSLMDSLLEYLIGCESDVIVFGQYIDFKGREPITIAPFNNDKVFTGYEGQKIVSKMCLVRDCNSLKTSADSGVFCNAVDKFIRKDLLSKSKVYFNENIRIGEDNIFFMQLYQHCNKIEYKNVLIYHYRMRKTSANHKTNGKIGYVNISVFEEEMRRILNVNDLYEELREALLYRCYDLIFEQFSISYISEEVGFLKKCKAFSREMEESPFREAINIVDYQYMSRKEKVKAFLLKHHLQVALFIIFSIKRKGYNNNDDFY